MKKIYPILILILLMSCISTKEESNIIPLWYSDSYENTSTSKSLVFKAEGNTKEQAEEIIKKDTEFLKKYILPTKEKEFINKSGYTYLIYSINKSELKSILQKDINVIYSSYQILENDGDKTSGILNKIKLYKQAFDKYSEVEKIEDFAKSLEISMDNKEMFNLSDMENKIKFTQEQIVFSVNVEGDINGSLKSLISRELNKKGYKTSMDGIIVIDAILTLTPAKLNNDYVNKFWDLQLSISNFYGDSSDSLSFNGRESQINNDSLDQLIVRVVSEKILGSLTDILP